MPNLFRQQLLDRFLTYTRFDTQSKPQAKSSPSSKGQFLLAQKLKQELTDLGLQDIELSEHCVLTAYLPSERADAPTIGLVAHLDTSPECSGKNVKAEVIENYRGGDIALGLGEEFISPVHSPFLHQLMGKTLIVTDGTTLLGADNKAGIAEIMTALAKIQQQKLPHCHLRIAFTPDEEIGLGMQFFPYDQFQCDWAYTIDGSAVGELEYENFNAASAQIVIHGRNIHTGYAKGKMLNALAIACEFQQALPQNERPEFTAQREGFFHLNYFVGDIERAEMHYLIRDFEQANFQQRKALLQQIAAQLSAKYKLPKAIECEIRDSYLNMYDCVQKVPQAIELADQAMRQVGIQPLHKVIRGGTDGAAFAAHGIACPNIFTGGYNFHSKQELITLEGMESAVDVIVKIAELAA